MMQLLAHAAVLLPDWMIGCLIGLSAVPIAWLIACLVVELIASPNSEFLARDNLV